MKSGKEGLRLPPDFADLEPFVKAWALPTEAQRYRKRELSDMEEIQHFYNTLLPRAEAALQYLDGYKLDEMPDEGRCLMYLLYSLATVSFCVEVWKQPRVRDSGIAKFVSINEPLAI